jgi:hypothetical protein
VPAVHHNGDRSVLAVSGADTQVGQIGIMVIKMGEEWGSRFRNRPEALQVVVQGFILFRQWRVLLAVGKIVDRVKADTG